MLAELRKSFPQPLVAGALTVLAGVALGGAWLLQPPGALRLDQVFLTVYLTLDVIAAYQFPVHVRFRQKVEMTTIPLYLMAVLLPGPAWAATAAGLSLLV